MIEVKIQYFRGCPNSEEMIHRVKAAIEGLPEINYIEELVETEEKAREVGFRGSPTLLINGKDFEGIPIPPVASLSCRVYLKGLPKVEDIRSRILEQIQ